MVSSLFLWRFVACAKLSNDANPGQSGSRFKSVLIIFLQLSVSLPNYTTEGGDQRGVMQADLVCNMEFEAAVVCLVVYWM